MALFGSLSEKLSHAFSKLTKHGVLTELEIKNAMREIRIALLEADVNYLVVKDLVNKISEKCSGERVLKSLTPGQLALVFCLAFLNILQVFRTLLFYQHLANHTLK